MLNLAFDDIRDKLTAHIDRLLPDMPNKDVINGMTADELNQLWQAEKQRILNLISSEEEYLTALKTACQVQISQLITLDFDSKPKGSFGLYMDK